jgi:hypothetical protein
MQYLISTINLSPHHTSQFGTCTQRGGIKKGLTLKVSGLFLWFCEKDDQTSDEVRQFAKQIGRESAALAPL